MTVYSESAAGYRTRAGLSYGMLCCCARDCALRQLKTATTYLCVIRYQLLLGTAHTLLV